MNAQDRELMERLLAVLEKMAEPEEPKLALGLYGIHGVEAGVDRIAKVLDKIERKTRRRVPRIIVCEHPELHEEEATA